MPSVTINSAQPGQTDLTSGYAHKERCTVAPDVLDQVNPDGLAALRPDDADGADGYPFQVRVTFLGKAAVYSVIDAPEGDNPNTVHMGSEGQGRLGIMGAPQSATVTCDVLNDPADPDPKLTEHHISGTETFLVVLAPHGGFIEQYTDEQALQVAGNSEFTPNTVTCWYCRGTGPGALDLWHITSTDISEHSFPKLNEIIDTRFTHAVSFHGFEDSNIPYDVVIGGLADKSLKDDIKQAIEVAVPSLRVHIVDPTDAQDPAAIFGATHERNIVNRLSHNNGIQIEQTGRARRDPNDENSSNDETPKNWEKIADAVASVYANLRQARGPQ